MNWEDEGFLLSKKKFRENAIIISAFTKTHGKISGIVYGGTSRKIKNYLQIGNRIFFIHSSKNRNKLGYLKTEIIEAISPRYFNDKKRSYLILSIADLLNSLLPDEEPHNNIYLSLSGSFLFGSQALPSWLPSPKSGRSAPNSPISHIHFHL